MADCSGNWIDSTITWIIKDGTLQNPPVEEDDGEFDIDPHSGSTVFTGHHHDPQGNDTVLFKTKCTDLGPDRFAIRIMRIDLTSHPPEIFEYRGEGVIIDPSGTAIITGTVKVHGPPTEGDTGTWETRRPGGGGEEDDEDEDDQ